MILKQEGGMSAIKFFNTVKKGDILLLKNGGIFTFEEFIFCKWKGAAGLCFKCPGKVKGKLLDAGEKNKTVNRKYAEFGFCERSDNTIFLKIAGNLNLLDDKLFEL